MPATRPILDRFIEKTEPLTSGCWQWTASTNAKGYGQLGSKTADGRPTMVLAHRFSYEHFIGPIPDGLTLDHLCRNTRCANPTHLEPVTNRENFMRGNHPKVLIHRAKVCSRGHALTPENTRHRPGKPEGTGACITCKNAASRASEDRRIAAGRKRNRPYLMKAKAEERSNAEIQG